MSYFCPQIQKLNSTDHLLKIAQEAAIEAGIKILEIYEGEIKIEFKEDESPLTLADKASNEVIMKFLSKTDIPVISEENKQIGFEQRKEWSKCWIVDPLDGTKEFIKRNGEFTVNIALVDHGIPVMGVIFVPVKNELFYGNDSGAFKLENIQSTEDLNKNQPLRLNAKSVTDQVTVVASRSHLTPETEEFIAKISSTDGVSKVENVSAGSSLKICMVAEGKADVYPRFAPTMEWDVAAGHAICRAAGVKMLQAGTDKELEYNKENLLNPWFVVGDRFGS